MALPSSERNCDVHYNESPIPTQARTPHPPHQADSGRHGRHANQHPRRAAQLPAPPGAVRLLLSLPARQARAGPADKASTSCTTPHVTTSASTASAPLANVSVSSSMLTASTSKG